MKRILSRFIIKFVFTACLLLHFSGAVYSQAFPDSTADVVIGQPDFYSRIVLHTQDGLYVPAGMAFDTTSSQHILYISERSNNRILGFYYPVRENSAPADIVIGQPDYTTYTSGASTTKLKQPEGIAVDTDGNLWVADQGNVRVLVFLSPASTDHTADYVLGQQGSFTTAYVNNQSGPSVNGLYDPSDVFVDIQKRVWVCDSYNNRVLVFNDPLTTDTSADWVIGQTSLSASVMAATDSNFYRPKGFYITSTGDLYVAEQSNHRVLKFTNPLGTDTKADQVFGQGGSFTSGTENNPSAAHGGFSEPHDVYVDDSGRVYISDYDNHRVLAYSTPLDTLADYVYGQNGSFSTTASSAAPGGLYRPRGVIIDKNGNLLIADSYGFRVLSYFLNYSVTVGLPDTIATSGDTMNLPMKFSEIDPPDSIFTFDFYMTYDTSKMEILGIDTAGFLSGGFNVQSNPATDDSFYIAGARSTHILPSSGPFLILKCVMDSSFGLGDTAKIEFFNITVNDAFPPADTIHGIIACPAYYGDVSANFEVTSLDASLVLQHSVRLITLSNTAQLAADVSCNGKVSGFDAANILLYAASVISGFPGGVTYNVPKEALQNAGASLLIDSEDNKYCTYFLQISGVKDIISLSSEINHTGLDLVSVEKTSPTQNYLVEFNTIDNISCIEMAGITELEGTEEVLKLKFKKKTEKYTINLNSVCLNDIKIAVSSGEPAIPYEYKLHQNFPNPFNPVTTIKYDLPENSRIKLTIYNILGQEIKTLINERKQAGFHRLKWDGTGRNGIQVSSGMYIYRIKAGDFVSTKKMVLLK